MSVPVIAFFNNKSGVGKTSMVYHLSWMFADKGVGVIAADLDPQGNLTSVFLDEDRQEEIYAGNDHFLTIFGAVQPLNRGAGNIARPHVEIIGDRLGLIPGDMALSNFEDQLSEVWPKCMNRDARAFRVTSAFWRILQIAAEKHAAKVILVDLGPNLGAINRSSLIASDFVVIPLGPDLFSLQALQNMGPALCRWRNEWKARVEKMPIDDLDLPEGSIQPIGYMVLRHSIRLDRPVNAFERWMARIPSAYRDHVLQEQSDQPDITVDNDKYCIANIKDYRSLMPLSQESRKPMFFLKPADGAIGAHALAVSDCYKDFQKVASIILKQAGIAYNEY